MVANVKLKIIGIILMILLSVIALGCIESQPATVSSNEPIPTLKELSIEEQKAYNYIDIQKVKNDIPNYINRKIHISGEISWIRVEDGTTEIILDIPMNIADSESVTIYFSGNVEGLDKNVYVDMYGVIKGDDEILSGIDQITIKVPMIYAVSLSIPSLKQLSIEEKKEYQNIDIRELIKNVDKFIDKKIRINGEVSWIEERSGNTLSIIQVPLPEEKYQSETIFIYGSGSTSILKGSKVVVFGIVKGKHSVIYETTGATTKVPSIFATSILKI